MSLPDAFKEIFVFFFKQELKSKRTRIFLLISFLPVLILVITKIVELTNPYAEVTAAQMFSRAMLIVYIQFLIPILALFFGSSIINEEVDNKTLVFLTTSPIPKPSIVLGKFVAYVLLGGIIVNIGLFLCFLTVNIDQLGQMVYVKEFFSFLGAGFLALVAYMTLFTLLGTIMKKAGVVFGLLFIFGWENLVQYFPGVTQKFTVIHWVKSMLPRVSEGSSFLQILMFRLEPSSTVESLIVLTIFVIGALTAASFVFKNKEYILSDSV
jgi:ABC-type transport system involved in multi-copper enzyme maturation permease subunit